ncbi:AbrB/MazE/SpoVT family DNA-binding domain-containing protein [Candidatus Woesearchaeota archaeon]|nr:AbrB/MazE/SpoVT family DNA-binding domain-containing protein [Candidatus Woesearchaeota archaeon]
MVKLQFDSNEQFKITLPKPIVLAKKWKKGDELVIELDERGDLLLRKKK